MAACRAIKEGDSAFTVFTTSQPSRKRVLAKGNPVCYASRVDQPRTVINIEETIGKQVGKRRPPVDPLRVSDSSIRRAREFHRSFPALMPKRGVYRFHSHTEANQWTQSLKVKKTTAR